MDKLKDLLTLYVPPNLQQLQQAHRNGKETILIPAAGGSASLTFSDYAKPGDKITFTFDSAAKTIRPILWTPR